MKKMKEMKVKSATITTEIITTSKRSTRDTIQEAKKIDISEEEEEIEEVITQEQLGYIYGAEILQRAVWRISHEDLLVAMSIKLRSKFLYHFISMISVMRKRLFSDSLRRHFYKWKLASRIGREKYLKRSTVLRSIIMTKDAKNKGMKQKYFSRWKYAGFAYKDRTKEIGTEFCRLYYSWTNKRLIKPKKDLINKIKIKYKKYRIDKEKYWKLFKLLRRGAIHKMMSSLKSYGRPVHLEKLIKTTMRINSNIAINKILKIIKRWRFIAFVNVLARKKLELMYKNLHVSYLEMADEVFNFEEDISMSQFQSFEKYGYNNYKFWDLNDPVLMKELGIDTEMNTTSIKYSKYSENTFTDQSTEEATVKNKLNNSTNLPKKRVSFDEASFLKKYEK